MTLPTSPQTFAALQAMQGIILNECLVSSASPFAALSAADTTRYGVSRAVFIGKPKDFKDAYLPQCNLWVPPGDEQAQPVELIGYASSGSTARVEDQIEAIVTVYVDLRTDWYAGEQSILQIRDALWPALLHHEKLGGSVAGVIESWAREGRGLCYEQVAGVDYRCYEVLWGFRQQWSLTGGRVV
jgi:hypothetical protein